MWLIPAVMSAVASALAFAARQLDSAIAASSFEWLGWLLYHGNVDGARTLLSTVAGSMITVTGVTFSVTMVALSLASSQFGPRLLLNFMRDRGNQLVLGTFISTFLYCLVALGIGGEQETLASGVSASLGLILALTSIGSLIYFIHHVASTIRAEHIVDVVARDVESAIDRILMEHDEDQSQGYNGRADVRVDMSGGGIVTAFKSGYIQGIDEPGLLSVSTSVDVLIKLLRRPGHFVIKGQPLASVLPASQLTSKVTSLIQQYFIIGRNRTDDQDPEYGIRQLVEVAVRALSPGINDPHTAILCVDWLSSVLHSVAKGRIRSPFCYDQDGTLRLICDPITFEGLVGASFDQIRQCSYSTPPVSIRIMEALASIARSVVDPIQAAVLTRQADALLAGAIDAGLQKVDQMELEDRYRSLVKNVRSGAG
jgi:uncharacterized membrane protein